ncbi:MAG: hypothetical protein LBE12_05700 [Planctomycetaceae bacterium]|jgi:hypothetical protein|nr:hypothetical protein [Planctomycetaceae bacterium]
MNIKKIIKEKVKRLSKNRIFVLFGTIAAVLFISFEIYVLFFSSIRLVERIQYPVDLQIVQNPDESNRVFHPNGMSMVHPNGWNTQIISTKNLDLYGILEFQAGNDRFPCIIAVHSAKISVEDQIPASMKSLIDTGKFSPVLFQNEKANESIERIHRTGNESPSFISGKIYFFRNEWCYLIRYRFVNKKMNVPDNLPLYLESFHSTDK